MTQMQWDEAMSVGSRHDNQWSASNVGRAALALSTMIADVVSKHAVHEAAPTFRFLKLEFARQGVFAKGASVLRVRLLHKLHDILAGRQDAECALLKRVVVLLSQV